jgi:hypothetical protein
MESIRIAKHQVSIVQISNQISDLANWFEQYKAGLLFFFLFQLTASNQTGELKWKGFSSRSLSRLRKQKN